MMTTEIRMPVMRETEDRWYWPGSTSPATLLALALLLVAVVYAYRYPAMKTGEAAQRLEAINALSAQSVQHTEAALSRLQVLIADQPEWLREVATEQTSNLQAQLSRIKAPSPERVLQKAAEQQEKYDQAQQLIETSPFKNLTKQQVPLSVEGKLFLSALEVKQPSRFDYQRLSDGVLDALPVLQEGFKLQAQTETLVHRLDVQLNGDKAGALGPAAVAEQTSGYYDREQQSEPQQPTPSASIDTLISAIRKAGRDAERQEQRAKLEAQNQARQVERDARQAKQQSEREQQKAQRLSIQRQRDTDRQASAAVEATRRAEQDSEHRLAAAKRQSEAAAEAKQRECTASIMARARCAAQGYNPLTGAKN